MTVKIAHIHSLNQPKPEPILSVLIPFYKDDPTELLKSLLSETLETTGVEI